MIIDITKSGYRRGYLPRRGVGVFHPFFATANAAFRRDALEQVGGFDLYCQSGEDIDACIRVAEAGWEMYFEPGARVRHLHRQTLAGLVKQWWQYGLGHAWLWKRAAPRGVLQFYRYAPDDREENPFGIALVAQVRSPIPGMIFISSFHFMWVSLLISLIFYLAGVAQVAAAAGVVCAIAAGVYFIPRLELRRPLRSLLLVGVGALADAAYVLGGLVGGVRNRVLYLEATRTRTERGAE